jgi:hypothetical protein
MSERLVVAVAVRRAKFAHAALCIVATPRTQFFFCFNETQPFDTLVESMEKSHKNKGGRPANKFRKSQIRKFADLKIW